MDDTDSKTKFEDDAEANGAFVSLSAMLDDEATELELRRVLRDVEQGDSAAGELTARWRRMNLAQSVLRGDMQGGNPGHLKLDLTANIQSALESEEQYQLDETWPEPQKEQASAVATPWHKQLIGFAAAAGLAAVLVLGFQGRPGVEPAPAGDSLASTQPVTTGAATTLLSEGGSEESSSSLAAQRQEALQRALLRERLGVYMRTHAEHASMNSSQGVMPLVRSEVSR